MVLNRFYAKDLNIKDNFRSFFFLILFLLKRTCSLAVYAIWCLYSFISKNFTFLQSLECGWITSRQIESALLLIVIFS